MKIEFKDLSGWLKAGIVFAWITFCYLAGLFLIGFIQGLLEFV